MLLIHSVDPFEYHILGGHLEFLPSMLKAQLRSSLLNGSVYRATTSRTAENGTLSTNTSEGVEFEIGDDKVVGVMACFGPGEELRA